MIAGFGVIAEIPRLLRADMLSLTAEGVTIHAGDSAWTVLPVLHCIPCQGDRPVVPLAGGAYRCSACGMLYDPNEASDVD